MRKYLAALMAVASVSVAIIELSCGSSSTQQVQQHTVATGSLAILASDAPLCALLSLRDDHGRDAHTGRRRLTCFRHFLVAAPHC